MAAVIRLQFLDGDSLSHPVLWICGCLQFMDDLCMEWGCLGVEFGADAEQRHSFRP